MIKIKVFCNWRPDASGMYIKTSELECDKDFNKKFKFVNDESYTHAILLNTTMPDLKVQKSNVFGLSHEPFEYLGLTEKFINYAKCNIGKYYIGQKNNLPEPFFEHHGYMWHTVPQDPISIKKKQLMSIIISKKKEAPGHLYRHSLVKKILNLNLPIHIYGRGSSLYNSSNVIGEFDKNMGPYGTTPYLDYLFHICIENFPNPEYFSEKITNCLVCNCTPIYFGCKNINNHFDNIINLTGDLDFDINLIKCICENPFKHYKAPDRNKIMKEISIKNLINNFIKKILSFN